MSETLWLVLRAAGLLLSFQAAGMALFVLRFARGLERTAPVIRRLALRSSLAALIVLAMQGLFEPIHMAGEWSGLGDAALWRLYLNSATGGSTLVRMVGLGLVAVSLTPARGSAALLALGGSIAIVGSSLLSGHTSVHPERLLLAPLLFVHLAILAFWFGSLWPLRELAAGESSAVAARVLTAFSSIAVWLVPLIAVAGAAVAMVLLPNFAALLEPYGLLLLVKLTLFALLMGLAALNRLRLAPALGRGEMQAAPRLRRSLMLEYLLICAAFAVTAVMTGMFAPTALA